MFAEQGWVSGARGEVCIRKEISDDEKGAPQSTRKRLALLGTCKGTRIV